jgi:hypothetical protein
MAISVGTAMHGLLALDEEGHPLTPLVTWADDRASDQAWQLHLSGQAADLQRVSGAPVHPMTRSPSSCGSAGKNQSYGLAPDGWIDAPEPELRLDVLYRLLYGACLNRVLNSEQFESERPLTWRQLTDELVDVACLYLLGTPAQ